MVRSSTLIFLLFLTLTSFRPLPAASEPATSSPADNPTTATASADSSLSASIPLGNAADDPQTSAAVMRILQESAAKYAGVDYFRAVGNYIEAGKIARRAGTVEEQYASRIELVYQRPARMRILVTGQDLAAGFVADGETVTYLWPNQREYRKIPQPKSLASFAEEERAGELLEDESNALTYSVVGALFISDDPLRWLHANVETYVYEGEEEVRGRPAWRIKFLQVNPRITVINWIDKETKFLSKVSIITARNSEGDFVEAYADAAYGRIRIAIFEEFKIGKGAVSAKDFTYRIPRGWKEREVEVAERPTRQENLSGWERLVRAAAAKKSEATTPTLTAQQGGEWLTLAKSLTRPGRVTALSVLPGEGETSASLLAASREKLALLNSDGAVQRELTLKGEPDLLALIQTGETTGPVVAAAESYGGTVRGYTVDGRELWNYQHPAARISSLVAARPPEAARDSLYIGYLDGTGMRHLSPEGQVVFASKRLTGLTCMAAGEFPGLGWRVAASTGDSGGFFSPRGELLSQLPEEDSDLQVGLLALEDSNASAPLIQVASAGEGDYVIRRVRTDGSPLWTVPLAQGLADAEPVGLAVAKLRRSETNAATSGASESSSAAEKSLVVLLSDGRLTVVSPDGNPLWRGKATFGEAESGNLAAVATSLAAADLNADGSDELYLGGEGGILRLETK